MMIRSVVVDLVEGATEVGNLGGTGLLGPIHALLEAGADVETMHVAGPSAHRADDGD